MTTAAAHGAALAAQVTQLGDALRSAHDEGEPVRIVGQGTWLDAGRPVQAARTLDVRALSGVIEYVPGDLVMTVAAGTTLGTIAAATREHGQWLALDPFGSDDGSIGATIATASSGPLALGAGRARDLVLGVSVLSADGTAIRAGGRVVKNVAGFDLVRLATGAFGTLGAITDVSLRLHALPSHDETFAVRITGTALAALHETLGHAALGYMALEILNDRAVQACGRDAMDIARGDTEHGWTLLARVTGNRARCVAQRELLGTLGSVREIDGAIWRALRALDGHGSAVARITAAPTALHRTVAGVQRCLTDAGIGDARLCVTPHRGSVRLVVPGRIADGIIDGMIDDAARVHRLLESLREILPAASAPGHTSLIWERLPEPMWSLLQPANDNLVASRIQDAFDPRRILNRGIFGTLPKVPAANPRMVNA